MTSKRSPITKFLERPNSQDNHKFVNDQKLSTPNKMVNPESKVQRKNRRRFRSKVSSKQHKVAAVIIGLLAIIVLVSMMASPHDQLKFKIHKDSKEYKKIQAELLNQKYEGEKVPLAKRDYGTCEIRKGIVPDYPIQSTFTASYPGSGAKMTWKLIEAMTGLVTGDDFQLNGHANIVSIKTHYPSNEGREIPGAENIPRAILLIRDPLQSIPSYFNFLYEYQNNLPGHSTKAPLEEWIKWRNDNLDRQLQVWRRHAEYWMDGYDNVHRLVISYENMIDDNAGGKEAMKIAEFLNRSDGVTTVTPEEVPCVWYTVVKYKKRRKLIEATDEENETVQNTASVVVDDPQSKRGGPKYIAPYTPQQLKDLIQVLTQLLERYRDDKDLAPILVSYIDEAARRSKGPPEDENTIVSNV